MKFYVIGFDREERNNLISQNIKSITVVETEPSRLETKIGHMSDLLMLTSIYRS